MATPAFLLPFTLSLLLTLSLTFPATGKPPAFLKSVSPSPFNLGTQKLSRFEFYWHDTVTGANASSINIVKPPAVNSSIPGFGFVSMIDDPMTEKPEIGSKMVGRAQGFYGECSQEELALVMSMNFVFMTGWYNGSTLTVVGRNPVNQKVREMPVVGGSGVFRFARGYVQASTYSFNTKTGDAVVRYNVYVMHY
ncbi:hypothetical protein L6452_23998 [Arctium lappa]|uniref:Uncharacterized protein n=1 Tax=Arctium lappa TaxID=4217 RepID=A0ACB9A8M9_ARCLA|nr:hypothetical protein L6452_23998 [Arctium lappa]